MTPFKASDRRTWKGRVYDRTGASYIRSLGTRKEADAKDIERMLDRYRRDHRWDVLDPIITRRLNIWDVYSADRKGTVHLLLEGLQREDAERAASENDPDLSPLVSEWATVAKSAKYPRQVRRLIADGAPFRRSRFTRATISTFLAGLTNLRGGGAVDGPTRNRYRVAFMQFAKWLVEREILATNPVRDVAGYAENDPRMVHYTRAQTIALVRSLEGPQRALEALMCATGVEWGAAERVRGLDIDPVKREVWAEGGKNRWRKRWVRFTEDWAWPIFWSHAKHFVGAARLFDLTEKDALAAHQNAVATLELPTSTLHDWRHTYAILSLDDGIKPQTVRRQLGHSPNSTVLERVYAAHMPTKDEDYAKRNVSATTKPTRKRRA